jgi:hypothetical protein
MEPTTTSTPSYGLAVVMLVVGLVLGAGGMYYYSTMAAPAATPEETATVPAGSAAVVDASDNPYAEVQTNPYDVQVNPFQ